MPKHLRRYTGQGQLHFITFCCYQRRALLGRATARTLTMKILGEVRDRYGFALIGYVLMPEHVHLLMSEAPGTSPAKVVQVFKQRVARRLRGKSRAAKGQLALRFVEDGELRRFWQRRYYDFNVYSEKKLREKLDYMHANPVKEKLVSHPREWPWSSWAHYHGGESLLAMDAWR